MKLYLSLPKELPRTALTLGTFDGVHLGHAAILKRLCACSSHTTVLTFLNHPLSLLHPPAPPLLTYLPIKLSLIASCGISALIALPFTSEFASLTFDALLDSFDLSHLVLGEGSSFGQNRQGNPAHLAPYATRRNFSLEYVPKFHLDQAPVSSSRIRTAIASGDLSSAVRLLGHPYFLPYPFPKAPPLALPPDGTYPAHFNGAPTSLTLYRGSVSLTPKTDETGMISL